MAIIDTTTFNGEHELFEIRYNILKDFVDEFIVVEFDKTFSGRPKEPSFTQKWDKVKYFFIKEEQWSKYLEMAEQSPNTKGAEHWKREFAMKESIKDCLTHLQDDDTVFVGDCDEIYKKEALAWSHAPFKLYLDVYTYYLNNKSSEQFFGTLISPYKAIRLGCLNHLRSDAWKTISHLGWHFTSMNHQVRQKLLDSYTSDSYASPQVMQNLEDNVKNNKDFLGRGFTFTIDESELPKYILDNRQKYGHLFRRN